MSLWEFLIVMVVGLLVIGPARLPEAVKTGFRWFTRIKSTLNDARVEFEQQIGADDIRRELHNEKVMKSLAELNSLKREIEQSSNEIDKNINPHSDAAYEQLEQADLEKERAEAALAHGNPLPPETASDAPADATAPAKDKS